ncbi:MAG TPA: PilZ domain-containing protein [Novosphingobium sp.]|nr:PilZ domain-containing protein [Novosphingobium sp.]
MKFLRRLFRRPEPTRAELRDSARVALMMRTAKLLSQHGEYLCTVLDVSQSGIRVGLFHAAPLDEFLFLELANGEVYPIQNVWRRAEKGGGEAGYRFSALIDVDAFVEEPCDFPRRPIRLNVQRWACLTAGGRDYQGHLVNLSQKGACVEIAGNPAVGEQVRLEVPGLPLQFGRICWMRKNACGLMFQKAFRMEELARHALALQPMVEADPLDAAESGGLQRTA